MPTRPAPASARVVSLSRRPARHSERSCSAPARAAGSPARRRRRSAPATPVRRRRPTAATPGPAAAPSADRPPAPTPDARTGRSPTRPGRRPSCFATRSGGGFVPRTSSRRRFRRSRCTATARCSTARRPRRCRPGPGDPVRFPPLQVARLTEDQVQALLADALVDGGLAVARPSTTNQLVADAPTTFFTLDANGIEKRVEVYALGIDTGGGPDCRDPHPARGARRPARQLRPARSRRGRRRTSAPTGPAASGRPCSRALPATPRRSPGRGRASGRGFVQPAGRRLTPVARDQRRRRRPARHRRHRGRRLRHHDQGRVDDATGSACARCCQTRSASRMRGTRPAATHGGRARSPGGAALRRGARRSDRPRS